MSKVATQQCHLIKTSALVLVTLSLFACGEAEVAIDMDDEPTMTEEQFVEVEKPKTELAAEVKPVVEEAATPVAVQVEEKVEEVVADVEEKAGPKTKKELLIGAWIMEEGGGMGTITFYEDGTIGMDFEPPADQQMPEGFEMPEMSGSYTWTGENTIDLTMDINFGGQTRSETVSLTIDDISETEITITGDGETRTLTRA